MPPGSDSPEPKKRIKIERIGSSAAMTAHLAQTDRIARLAGADGPLANVLRQQERIANLMPRYNPPRFPTASLRVPKFTTHVGLPNLGKQFVGLHVSPLVGLNLPDYGSLFRSPALERIAGYAGEMAKRFKEAAPPNWPDEDAWPWDVIETILRDEGIPLAWVPRLEIFDQVTEAVDRSARIAILMANQTEVIEDCEVVLDGLDEEVLAGYRIQAVRAVAAFRDGHEQVAMSHAVSITEAAVREVIATKYKLVKDALDVSLDHVPFLVLRGFAALVPLHTFYAMWFAESGEPPPIPLSRHVVAHANKEGVSRDEHPLLAIMYLASVLRGLEDWLIHDLAQLDPLEMREL